MSQTFEIHPELITILTCPDFDHFKIPQMCNKLISQSKNTKSMSAVRSLIVREINKLIEQGLLISKGKHRNKQFTKTELFHQVQLNPAKKSSTKKSKSGSPVSDNKSCLSDLRAIKSQLDAELAISLAETEKYRHLMKQFPLSKKYAHNLHQQSSVHSAKLTGEMTAITKLITAISKDTQRC